MIAKMLNESNPIRSNQSFEKFLLDNGITSYPGHITMDAAPCREFHLTDGRFGQWFLFSDTDRNRTYIVISFGERETDLDTKYSFPVIFNEIWVLRKFRPRNGKTTLVPANVPPVFVGSYATPRTLKKNKRFSTMTERYMRELSRAGSYSELQRKMEELSKKFQGDTDFIAADF